MIPSKYKKYKPVYFDKGKRSVIYKFKKGKKDYIIKSKHPDSKAIGRLSNEAKYLKILNKKEIGPKLVDSGKDYIVYEFVKGKFIKDIKVTKKIATQVLNQCRTLDKLGIIKEEMHHPVKHVLVDKNKVTMIDFERCHYSKDPKNVTQFIHYLFSIKFLKRTDKVLKVVKEYSKDKNDKNFKNIIKII